MTIKILYTVFVLLLNYLIYKKISKGESSKSHIILLAIYFAIIVALNYIFNSVSHKLILFLLLFSFSIILLNFFKSFVNVYERSDLLDNGKVKKIKSIIFNIIMPIMITVYQIILIWLDKLFEEMIR
jgi:hypothetical protein